MFELETALILAVALGLDAAIGDPEWMYRRGSHPVDWIALAIRRCEARWNSGTPFKRQLLGGVLAVGLGIGMTGIGGAIVSLAGRIPAGWILVSLVVSILLAQRSLYCHVQAVGIALTQSLEEGRQVVGAIVGRKTGALDRSGVTRAAIESCAESFCDGIVAPVFWFLIAGLPGLLTYKAINTADSLVGHRCDRYRHFGAVSARLDDLMNWIPARLSTLILICGYPTRLIMHLPTLIREARLHPSPNAGWAEATFARILNVALAGPREYDHGPADLPWFNSTARRDLDSADIFRSLNVLIRGIGILWGIVGLLFMALYMQDA